MLKPRIFVSSVSRELGSARQLVANTLTAIDYEPVWQDIFLTEGGDLRKMLRDTIDGCSAVIQLVGDAYGAEPPTIDHLFGRVSYTQYEALYAEKQNKKVYYLFLDNKFPKDNPVEAVDKLPGEETDEKFKERQFLQATYKERIRASGHLRSKSSSSSELESSILKLRNDLRQYRRNTKLLFAGIFGAIAVVLGGITWVNFKQDDQTRETRELGKLTASQAKALEDQAKLLDSQKQQISAVNLKQEQLLEILRELPKVMAKPEEGKKEAAPQQNVDNAYQKLEKKYDIKEGTLKESLTDLSKEIKSKSSTPPLDRANAFYVAKQYAEAEKFALEAKELALKEGDKSKAVEALVVAGNSALSQPTNQRAVEYFKTADELTDAERDFDQWAKIKRYYANQLVTLERAKEAINVMENSRDAIFRKYGANDPRMWDFNLSLAVAYRTEKNYTQSYSLFKEVYENRLAKFGATDRETLDAKFRFGSLMRVMPKLPEARQMLESTLETQQKSFGEKDVDALTTMNNLALTYADLGLYDKSIELFKKLLDLRIDVNGEKSESTIFVANNMVSTMNSGSRFSESLPIAEKYYQIAKSELGSENPITLFAMANNAESLYGNARYQDAIKLDEELVKIRERISGPTHPDTIRAISYLAGDYTKAEQFDKAISLYEKAISLATQTLGPEDPLTLGTMSSLGNTYYVSNQIDKAKNLLQSVYPSQKTIVGFDSIDTRNSLNRLRSVYLKIDESDKAFSLYQEDVDLTAKKNGPESSATIDRVYELALTYELFKKPELALPHYEKVLKFRTQTLGADNDLTITAHRKVEQAYRESRQYDKAIEIAKNLTEILTKKLGPENRQTITAIYLQALNHESKQEYDIAIPIYEQVRAIEQKTLPEGDVDRLTTLERLRACYVASKQARKAIPIVKELVEADRKKLGADHKDLVTRIYGFALNQFDNKDFLDSAATVSEAIQIERERKVNPRPAYMAFLLDLKGVALCKAGKYADALPLLKEVLDIRKANPAEKWYVPDAESAYGAALAGVKKFADAEPLLLSGYNGLKSQFSAMPDYEQYRFADSIERLVDFYTVVNKPAEVTKWKAALEDHRKAQSAKTAATN